MITLKTEEEIEILKRSGEILSKILKSLKERAIVGTNILELEEIARKMAKEANAVPSFLGYQPEGASRPYPAAICASVNEVVVHGVPKDYVLRSGDVLKIDMGIVYEGMYTDSAITVGIGKISPQAKKLIDSTKKALKEAISVVKKGNRIGDIGYVIERRAAKDGFKVLKALTGHGVGYQVHEDPVVFNYGEKGTGPKIEEGMVLAIEPMFSISCEDVIQNSDESYSSADGSLTSQFEHTVAVTRKGVIVLTE
jgi:methionyl aminopeptidase